MTTTVRKNLIREAARKYRRRHWKRVPIPLGKKHPTIVKWQLKEFEDTDFTRLHNIGVQFGQPSDGLTDVDLDCDEARALAPYFLPKTGARFGRKSSPAAHRLYNSDIYQTAKKTVTEYDDPEPQTDAGEHDACMLELRTGALDKEGKPKGALSMFPPSRHPSGELVEWDEEGEPAEVEGATLKRAVAKLAAATLLARHWPPKGKRQKGALVVGGVLARASFDADEITEFVKRVAQVAGDDEAEQRGHSAAAAVERLKKGDDTPGLPRLREVWGEKIAKQIADWLDLPRERSGANDPEKKKREKETQALTLLKLAPAEPHGGLFRTKDQVVYADIINNGHRETWRVESTTFRRWLVHQYYLKTKEAPGREAVTQALDLIEARALFDEGSLVRDVFVRVGGHDDGKIYLDLCDEQWRAVEIGPDGWRVVSNPPVRFRRAPGMLPLPEPQRGGSIKASIEELRQFVNVRVDGEEKQISDADFVLVVAWLLAAYRERGPYPIMKVWGEPGSAKSTMTEIFRSLTDPHEVTRRELPRKNHDLFIAANNEWVLSYDNVSHIPDWMSNPLCVIATGGGFATRTLYTDQDEQLFRAQRPVILNGVENFRTRHDIADRMIMPELPFIPAEQRRREREFWADFNAKRPRILGALLDVVAHGLKMLPKVPEQDWPRMADFAHWITACEGALWEAGTFKKAYDANRRKATLAAIEDDAVATALRAFVNEDAPEWRGTTGALLNVLTASVVEGLAKNKEEWPQSARALTGRLQTAKGALRHVGINIEQGPRTSKGRVLIIKRTTETLKTKGPETPSQHTHRHFRSNSKGLQRDGQRDEAVRVGGKKWDVIKLDPSERLKRRRTQQ